MYKYLADSNVDWGQNNYYLEDYIKQAGDTEITVNPDTPACGKIIVSVNRLVGIFGNPLKFKWLRENYEPVHHIAYSNLLYQIPCEEK